MFGKHGIAHAARIAVTRGEQHYVVAATLKFCCQIADTADSHINTEQLTFDCQRGC